MLTCCWQPLCATMLSNLEQMFDKFSKTSSFSKFCAISKQVAKQTPPFNPSLRQHKVASSHVSNEKFSAKLAGLHIPRPKMPNFQQTFRKSALSQVLFAFDGKMHLFFVGTQSPTVQRLFRFAFYKQHVCYLHFIRQTSLTSGD